MTDESRSTGRGIRVALIEDHTIVRRSLERMLVQDARMNVVGSYESGEAALRALTSTECDVLVVDLSLPGIGGLAVMEEIRERRPNVGLLVLTAHSERIHGLGCLTAGAGGFLTKGCSPEELIDAVCTVAAGRRYLTPAMTEVLANRIIEGVPSLPHEALSQREFEVFTMLARGDSSTEIGQRLFISVKTVSTYRSRVLAKLGFTRNAELTGYAIEHGLLGPRPPGGSAGGSPEGRRHST